MNERPIGELERFAGFATTKRDSSSYKPDIILLDLAMPKMNGLQAAPELRYKNTVVTAASDGDINAFHRNLQWRKT